MATSPNQTPEDPTTPRPYVPTHADVQRRLAELQRLRPQRNPNRNPPPPTPEQLEPPRAASPHASLSYRDPGLRGAATSRGEAQVLRLSALYAALDASEMVCLPHLEAAYAVWTYCYRSAVRLFGLATGDPIADRICEAVQASPNGLSRNQISRLFYGHVDSERIDAALQQLAAFGALAAYTEQTSGRSSTRWLAVQH